MTDDPSHISYLKQFRFYIAMKCNFKWTRPLRAYIARLNSRPVGYLMIRCTGDSAHITEAVDCPFRKLGIGRKLIQFAQSNHDELVAKIKENNHASIALHESMGFALQREGGSILLYRYRRH